VAALLFICQFGARLALTIEALTSVVVRVFVQN